MISRIKALLSSIDLRRLDTRRIDLAMAWAQRHPLATAAYNLGNYVFLGAVKVAQWAALAVVKARNRIWSTGPAEQLVPDGAQPHPTRRIPSRPRVLILAEDSIPQCFEYRVRQKLDMLAELDWEAAWLPWSDIDEVRRALHFYDVLLLYRVPGFDPVLEIIRYALSINRLLLYDLDDLVFDRARLEEKFARNRGQLSLKVYRDLLTGADLYRQSMSLIPYCIASTDSLREQVERVHGVTGFVLPNGLSTTLLSGLETGYAADDGDSVILFYGSGTKTHDADFMMVTPVLLELLEEYPQSRLVIAGPLQIAAGFGKFGGRVQTIEFLEYASYLDVLKCAHINIAPLEPGVFADCKSEIKWLEAGMLGLPSVVSTTRTFEEVIAHGETGFIAATPADWKASLERLIENPDLRKRVGRSARQEITRRYGRDRLARTLRDVVEGCIDASPSLVRRDGAAASPRRLLLVNTLYPPQSMGGATRVVKGLVDALTAEHRDDYEITVFTCDVQDTRPYHLREYAHDGVVVMSLSVPMRPELERLYEDDKVRELFLDLLRSRRPDIVHFHSVQRLTASMLQAAAEHGAPYVVTLHDSWWLSDFPFMIDDHGNPLPENIGNPLVAAGYSTDINATAERNRYLRDRLLSARALIGVSDYQRDLYRINGFTGTITIENGVDAPAGFSRNDRQKLVLGFAGGRSEHKGYYFLKDCVSSSRLVNVEVVVVDLFSKSTHARTEDWNGTRVEIHPRFDFSNIGAFYSMVDVMVVPSMWPESFGLVVREAALLGLWIVASESGGLKGSVIHGETGFVFPQGDRDALVDILAELERNPSRYKQAVDPAATANLGIVSVADNARAVNRLYQDVLSGP